MADAGRGEGPPERGETAPRGLTRIVLRGAGLAGAGFFLTQVITFVSYLALARLATPEDFGKLAAAMILVSAGTLLAGSGMLAALIQRKDRMEEAASTAFASTVLGGVAFSLLALALAPAVGLYFRQADITTIAAAVSGLIFLGMTTVVPSALMQRRFSFVRRVVIEPAGAAAFGLSAGVACAKGMGVWGLVLGTYVAAATQTVLSWVLIAWRPKLGQVSFKMWKELIRYGRHILGTGIVQRLTGEAETALLGRFVSVAALGQYRYATRMGGMPTAATLNVASYVLFPAFSRISGQQDRFVSAFLRSLRWIAVVTLPLGFAFLVLGEPLAVVAFGERWRPAGEALMALSLASPASSLSSLCAETFKAHGRPDILPKWSLLMSALRLGCIVALLPLGLVGIAAALSISAVGAAGYGLRRASRLLEIPVGRLLAEIWPPALAAGVMSAALLAADRLVLHADGRGTALGVAVLITEALAGAIVYLAVLLLVAPETARELRGAGRAVCDRLRRRYSSRARLERKTSAGSRD